MLKDSVLSHQSDWFLINSATRLSVANCHSFRSRPPEATLNHCLNFFFCCLLSFLDCAQWLCIVSLVTLFKFPVLVLECRMSSAYVYIFLCYCFHCEQLLFNQISKDQLQVSGFAKTISNLNVHVIQKALLKKQSCLTQSLSVAALS